MGKKRLCAWILVLAMCLPLVNSLVLPVSAAPVVAVTTDTASSAAPFVKYATSTEAFLKNIKLETPSAWNLKITADAENSGQTYVVVLRYDLFDNYYNDNGKIKGIAAGTYNTLKPGNKDEPNYYRSQGGSRVEMGAKDVTLFQKGLFNFNGDNSYKVGETSSNYHMKYAAIIFDGNTSLVDLTSYTIVTFYIDSSGMLQTESYMLRYLKNKYPNPSGSSDASTMASNYQIEPWGEGAAINTGVTPSRRGYTFKGWDADGRILNSDANKAAQMLGADGTTVVAPTYAAGAAGTVDWSTVSQKFGTTEFNKTSDKFYDLYAIWQPNKVEFSETNETTKTPVTAKITYGGSEMDIPMLNLPSPQVGVTYSQTGNLEAPTTDSGTDKSYAYLSATVNLEDGTSVPTVDPFGDASASDPQKKYNLKTEQNTKTSWKITGKPDGHSKGKPVYVLLQVTDKDNQTTDLILLRFAEIKKGAQHKPDEDVNTGLEGTAKTLDGQKPETSLPESVEKALIAELQAEKDKESGSTTTPEQPEVTQTPENPEVSPSPSPSTPPASTATVTRDDLYSGGFTDGMLIGMYSAGQKEEKDSNGTAMTDKTGTYTNYWLGLGALYEYRPLTVDGETLTYADDETGWREVPFRKDKYTKADDLKKVEAAMGYKAAAEAITTTNGATVAKVEEKTLTTPWPANYGWIQWNGNLPEIHGFSVGDIVQLRFKSNENYSASEIVPITIGGGGGGTADPSSFATVVCFDWDDTYLGAVIVPKGATAQKVNDELTKYIAGNESFKKALEGKPGYDFTHWVDYSYTGNDGSTAWGTKAITLGGDSSNDGLRDVEKPLEANFEGLQTNLAVKAAYKINDKYRDDNLVNPDNRYYKIDREKIQYSKMGSSNEYSITVKVERLSPENKGIQRLVQSALRVTMTDKSDNNSFQLIYLDNTDSTTATFAVNGATMKYFTCEVVDVNGVSAWNTGAAGRSESYVIEAGTPSAHGFVYEGTFNQVNELLGGTSLGPITLAVLKNNLGLNTGSLKVADARKRLQKAYADKGGALTIEEMQAALNA